MSDIYDQDTLKLHFLFISVALLPTFYLQTHFFTDIAQQFIFPLNSSSEKAFAKIDNYEAMTNASYAR